MTATLSTEVYAPPKRNLTPAETDALTVRLAMERLHSDPQKRQGREWMVRLVLLAMAVAEGEGPLAKEAAALVREIEG